MSRAFTSAENSVSVWKTTCTSRKAERNCSLRKATLWRTRSERRRTQAAVAHSEVDSLHHPFPHAAQQRGGRLRFQYHQPVLILAGIDAGASLQLGQHL